LHGPIVNHEATAALRLNSATAAGAAVTVPAAARAPSLTASVERDAGGGGASFGGEGEQSNTTASTAAAARPVPVKVCTDGSLIAPPLTVGQVEALLPVLVHWGLHKHAMMVWEHAFSAGWHPPPASWRQVRVPVH